MNTNILALQDHELDACESMFGEQVVPYCGVALSVCELLLYGNGVNSGYANGVLLTSLCGVLSVDWT
jgi:hypothetical protein